MRNNHIKGRRFWCVVLTRPLTRLKAVRHHGQNALWNVIALVAKAASTFAVLGLAYRRLSSGEVGFYVLILSCATAIGFIEGALVIDATVRSANDDVPDYARSTKSLNRAVLAAVLGVPLVVGVATGYLGFRHALLLATTAGAAVVNAASGVYRGRVIANRGFAANAKVTIAGAAARISLSIVLIGALGVGGLGCAVAAEATIILLFAGRLARVSKPARSKVVRPPRNSLKAQITISASGQLMALTDVVGIALILGVTPLGPYRAGTALPGQGAEFAYRVTDSILPAFARARTKLSIRTWRYAITWWGISTLVPTCAFIATRHFWIHLLVGRASLPDFVGNVAAIAASIVWVNTAKRPLEVWLTANGFLSVLARWVPVEIMVNLVATLALVVILGPVGGVFGTLIATIINTFVFVPLAARREPYVWQEVRTSLLRIAMLSVLLSLFVLAFTHGPNH